MTVRGPAGELTTVAIDLSDVASTVRALAWSQVGIGAAVLLIVFEMSSFIDSWTSARLAAWAQEWQPTSTAGVVGRAVADGMVGLVGIVAPYMLPLVLL